MSKGSIVDCRVRVEPSEKLVNFIKSLEDYDELSENVMHIYNSQPSKKNKSLFNKEVKTESLNNKDLEYLKDLKIDETEIQNAFKSLNIEFEDDDVEDLDHDVEKETKKKPGKNVYLLTLTDLKFLNNVLIEKRKKSEDDAPYLHELLEGSKIILPKNEIIPRNPELEARCKKLREEQQNREYRSMTKDVDSVRRHMPEDTIAYQIKSINSQLIAVAQFIFSVAAGFAFGFLGVELIVGGLDFGFRLLLGIICALTIALAEIYFLAKKLNEIEDTVEFEKTYIPKMSSDTNLVKSHKD